MFKPLIRRLGSRTKICFLTKFSDGSSWQNRPGEPLVTFHPTPGFCDEVLHLFRATRLEEAPVHPDDDEVLEVKWHTLDAARGLLHAGEIKDAKTIIALLMESEQRARKARR